jgi:pyrroline-5-carboxylate reductase
MHLVQAIPLPFVSDRNGVTAIYPPDTAVAALFDTLGSAVQRASRKEYDLLAAASALMSTYFGVTEIATAWLAELDLRNRRPIPISPLCSRALPDAQTRTQARALPN